MRIALVGTRGVPARYGGFETAVEEIGRRLVLRGHEVVVYCRGREGGDAYHGMELVHVPSVRRKTLETLTHTGASALHLLWAGADAAVVFNVGNAPFLPVIRAGGTRVALHVDGLEWQRQKWGPSARRYFRRAERFAVRWADALIADSQAMQDYYRRTYRVETRYLAYGASGGPTAVGRGRLAELALASGGYHLIVARFEPENNVDLLLRGYVRSAAELPLVVVGGAPYGRDYTSTISALAAGDRRVHLLGLVYDQELLGELYAGARSYLHGHSVGGTNPSLLRALSAGTPVIANDVVFNREVAGDTALYFTSELDVAALVEKIERDPAAAGERGQTGQARVTSLYDWEVVADGYEALCRQLVSVGDRAGRGRIAQEPGWQLQRSQS